MEKKRRTFYIVSLIIFLVIVLAVAGFFIYKFSYTKTCGDKSCFDSAMGKCSKASFIDENPESVWEYTVKGEKEGMCDINVRLLEVKKGTSDLEELNGLEMDCSLPLGLVATPNADLSRCHGVLKESLQEMIINKMHAYILENVGKISEELNKVV